MMKINMNQLHLLAKISHHLVVQSIAFLGHNEKKRLIEQWQFLELLELIKMEAPQLAKHIAKYPKNALYTSSDS